LLIFSFILLKNASVRILIIFCLLLLATTCNSQKFILRDLSDSMNNVNKARIGKSFPAFKARDINGIYFSDFEAGFPTNIIVDKDGKVAFLKQVGH
jgi:hypothetical protein